MPFALAIVRRGLYGAGIPAMGMRSPDNRRMADDFYRRASAVEAWLPPVSPP
jgi:hypothetical protein